MDTSIKSIIKEMDKPLTEKIINISNQVSTDFKYNETAVDDVTPHVTKEEPETLRKLTSDLYKQAVETGRINLEEKRIIRDMWEKKYILSKWYNKWYYRIMFKRAVNNYMMCAGEQYYIERELCDAFKSLENIEEILCNKSEIIMDFVTYEVAKKLKEKGFKEPCFATYDNDGMLGYVYYQPKRIHAISFDDCLYYGDDVIVAPTILQVLDWLRKEKRIDSGAVWDNRDGKWVGYINEMDMPDLVGNYVLPNIYDTYEKAALAGIEYVLDKLIKYD